MKYHLLAGYTDIHTHILPGMDDGAPDTQTARDLVQMALDSGIRTLFLTPHYRGRYKKNTPEILQNTFEAFRQQIASEFPEMRLYLGNEIHYQTDVPELLANGMILPLAGSQYVLLEFQCNALRSHVLTGVHETIRFGFIPIIAHAERCNILRSDKSLVDEILEIGSLIQLNADSIMGQHGFSTKRFCHKLLKSHRVHFIASDAHDAVQRPPLLHECFLRICKKYGEEYAAQVFYHNAQAIVDSQIY